MSIVPFLNKLPDSILYYFLKMAYRRNGKKLESVINRHNKRFWIYKVNGNYIAAESLSWYLDEQYLIERAYEIPLWHYKPAEGSVIIDLGAGLGEEAIVFSKMVGVKGRVFCIEANPSVYSVLNEVVQKNGMQNTEVHHLAISENNNIIELEDNDASYLSASEGNNKGSRKYSVKGTGFDSFIEQQNLTHIDFLKVNIEGAERYLVNSGSKHLPNIKNLAISTHDFRFKAEGNEFFRTKELITSFLKNNGYELRYQQTGVPHIDDWIYGTKRG